MKKLVASLRERLRRWLLDGRSLEFDSLEIVSRDGKSRVRFSCESGQATVSLTAPGNEAHLAVTGQLAILTLGSPHGTGPLVSVFTDAKGRFFEIGGTIYSVCSACHQAYPPRAYLTPSASPCNCGCYRN